MPTVSVTSPRMHRRVSLLRFGEHPLNLKETTLLTTGVSIDIPVGTAFQYRCTGADPLQFLCITMPPWPGDQEATVIEGPWKPTAPEGW